MGTANATQEKASEFVLIRILGKEHAWSDHTTRRQGVHVIEVTQGERIVWENTQNQVCTVTFTRGGCPFGHKHAKCLFTIEPVGTREEDIVRAEVGREFEFSAQFDKDTDDDQLGTPKIIVKG
jgi:hypothetical protein